MLVLSFSPLTFYVTCKWLTPLVAATVTFLLLGIENTAAQLEVGGKCADTESARERFPGCVAVVLQGRGGEGGGGGGRPAPSMVGSHVMAKGSRLQGARL